MRLIDADALKKIWCDDCENKHLCEDGIPACYDVQQLNALPTIDAITAEKYTKIINDMVHEFKDYEPVKHGRWIPCSERMPKEEDRFLVTINLTYGYVLPFIKILSYGFPEDGKVRDKMCFYTYDCELGDIEYDGVLAWMPLPEPYREVEENDRT